MDQAAWAVCSSLWTFSIVPMHLLGAFSGYLLHVFIICLLSLCQRSAHLLSDTHALSHTAVLCSCGGFGEDFWLQRF